MTSELLVKRLLKQAGVSVLAGLMMSSAVLAEDISEPVGEHHVEVSTAVEGETAGEDETAGPDPVEHDGGFEGEDFSDPDNGENPDEDFYTTDLTDPADPIDPDVFVDPMPDDSTGSGEDDGEVVYDSGCAECSGEPEFVTTTGGNPDISEPMPVNGGFEPEHRGDVTPAPTFGRSSGGDDDTICKPVWTKGIAKIEC